MSSIFDKALSVGKHQYPNKISKRLEYGTAGFRDKSYVLPHVMYRMGLLASLRSKCLKSATIGVMVTASHNPAEDNGVKLCDPMGDMINMEWEKFATDLVNSSDEELSQSLQNICKINNIDHTVAANVYLGMDTRSSSQGLADSVAAGVKALDGHVQSYGVVSTPQLHYVVRCKATDGGYGVNTREGYYRKLSTAFKCLNAAKNNVRYEAEVFVDGANGVGACAMKELIPHLDGSLNVNVFNDGFENLNHKCGADYIKTQQTVPAGANVLPGKRYASLDGDADRLVYFYLDENNEFHLLDGDKIATLIAKYLAVIVRAANLDFDIKLVQTAYANGSSTQYIENVLKIDTKCVQTGVKYLHHEATKYDIGIYFEANGHGTVLFSEAAKEKIVTQSCSSGATDIEKENCEKLFHIIDLINEAVGDAISDFLLVETILRDFDFTISDWNHLYTDKPCRELKVKVENRSMFSTTAEGISIKPEGLQPSIDLLVARHTSGRSFVRPSGTEDVVRIYAEADTQEHADELAKDVADEVKAVGIV